MTLDPTEIASSWLQSYAACLTSGDVKGAVSCFQDTAFLRDLLVFTWNNRTLHGHEEITAYLENTLAQAAIADFKLDFRPGLLPEIDGFNAQMVSSVANTVSAGFTFGCKVGKGQGYFFLVPTDAGEWKAISVMMRLADISGHEEWIQEEEAHGGHTLSWTDVNRERREKIEKDPYVLISSCRCSMFFLPEFESLHSRSWTQWPQCRGKIQTYEHTFTGGRIQHAYRR